MAGIRDAATLMTSGRFRHLPVMGDAGLVGIVDTAARFRRCPDSL
jgi:CBS domain-containing protein